MNQRNTVDRRGRFLRRYDYDDATVIAADLNAADDDVTVDTVDGTAIVVIAPEGDRDDEEFEFELPGPAASVDIENGVLTIEVHA
ncbi:Hsp20/alpha crystallin family protein [Halobaculum sp. WSA2]|uniref:Hsp20/alpha crystallin family protein n=1 Tax=Halobaculum saliterrae TaxID=2073113 RepID=A0A6B0T317_9EURY|nr:Hsp20/alpha crystallin family protein [Halobaculum saliterrae]MXR42690.1 Hsp20/alpha crystallin family protein [Halobaculum saliterrae]